jgi:hypothetical protein
LEYLTTHTSLSPIRRWFAPSFVNYKRCTRFAAASERVYQLLAHGRWFSPGTPASSTTKTGRHDISLILINLKDIVISVMLANLVRSFITYSNVLFSTSLDLRVHTSLSPIRRGFAPGFVNYKRCTRLAAASDKVYQLLAHGRWFSPGTRLPPPLNLVAMIYLKYCVRNEKYCGIIML